jgi:DNA-binding MarR family transcriptional regulator
VRLRIIAALYAAGPEGIAFTRLRMLVRATDGNLSSHLSMLERAGYIEIAKQFVARRPRTLLTVTTAGVGAFRGHLEFLREILATAGEG